MRYLIALLLVISCQKNESGEMYQDSKHCKLLENINNDQYCKISQGGYDFCTYTHRYGSQSSTSVAIDCKIFDNMKKVKVIPE